jgi:hypothetical protein
MVNQPVHMLPEQLAGMAITQEPETGGVAECAAGRFPKSGGYPRVSIA